METPAEILLGTLRDLKEEEFETFKWFLQQKKTLELKGFRSIPVSRLEHANHENTVDLMVQTHSEKILKVTLVVLEKIGRHDLVDRLLDASEPAETSTEDGGAGPSAVTDAMKRVRHQDLSDNRPAPSKKRRSSPEPEDGRHAAEERKLDRGGRLRADLKKYFRDLTVDTNSAHRMLVLSENNRTITFVRECQPYPEHQDRFDRNPQLLCSTGLTGRCYWEVEWSGWVYIAVAYKGIRRKVGPEGVFGWNQRSWSLHCSSGYTAWHKGVKTDLPHAAPNYGRVSVYVDCEAGTLTFYEVSSDHLLHLHTFNTTFTEPPYAGFGLISGSVCLCDV